MNKYILALVATLFTSTAFAEPINFVANWNAVEGATIYRLQERVNGAAWTDHNGLSTNTVEFTADVIQGDLVEVRVKACYSVTECSDYSAPVGYTVPAPVPVPTGLTIDINNP